LEKSPDGSSVELIAKEKTNYGKGSTAFLIRRGPVPNLCPLLAYRTIKSRAAAKGLVGTLWGSKSGVPYKQAAALSRLLKDLLKAAGIPPMYTASSIRHALITELFNRGLKEQEVNAYTGHSNNAHTALTNYFHLEENWVGRSCCG
jgi:integrase